MSRVVHPLVIITIHMNSPKGISRAHPHLISRHEASSVSLIQQQDRAVNNGTRQRGALDRTATTLMDQSDVSMIKGVALFSNQLHTASNRSSSRTQNNGSMINVS